MFQLGKIVAAMLLPPGLTILLSIASLLFLAHRAKKAAIALSIASLLSILPLSLPLVGNSLIRSLEEPWDAEPFAIPATAVACVIILGGGMEAGIPEGDPTNGLSGPSLSRAIAGWELARVNGLPILVAGVEAPSIASFLRELGAEHIEVQIEKESRNTAENALNAKRFVPSGPCWLVTSAWHMRRALMEFRAAGFVSIPRPMDFTGDPAGGFADFLPSASALEQSRTALHEYLGIAAFSLGIGRP